MTEKENNNKNNYGNETKIRKVLFNEISFLVAGIGLVSSVMFWVMNPQQEMALQIVGLESQIESYEKVGNIVKEIKDNDLNEMELQMTRIENRQIKMIEAIAELKAQL